MTGGWSGSSRSSATATTSRRSTPWSNAPKPSPPANGALKKDRFVKITDTDPAVDWDLVERAQHLAGLKGYVTNIDPDTLTGEQVVTAYHDLYQVERSFRMTKSDLAARPIFHRLRDSIEAHLTIVFAALAVSREAQARTGLSHQQDREDAAAAADRHDHPRRPADHRPTTHPRRTPQRILDDLARGGH